MPEAYIRLDVQDNPLGFTLSEDLPFDSDGNPRFMTINRGKQWYKPADIVKPVLGADQHYEGPQYTNLDQETAQIVFVAVNNPPPPPPDVRVTDGSGTVTRAEMNALKEYLRSRL